MLLIIAHSRAAGGKKERKKKNRDACHIFIHKNPNRKLFSPVFCVYNIRFSNALHCAREIDEHTVLNILNSV